MSENIGTRKPSKKDCSTGYIDFWDLPYLLWYPKYTESTVHLIISKHVNIEIPYLKKRQS